MTELEEILHQAGRMMLDWQDPKVEIKEGHANFVTEADKAVQTFLMEHLSKLFPEAVFLAEEQDNGTLTDRPTFIIDPIDGTTNYFRRRSCSVISVALAQGKKPMLGMIYDPYRGKLYRAETGKGAFVNDMPIHVSDTPFERALIGFGTAPYYEELMTLTTKSVGTLLPVIADLRRSGSAATDLCEVATGILDGMFEWRLQPWDYAAGSLIITESGGKCGSILGGDADYGAPTPYVAANSRCFDQLRETLYQIQKGSTACILQNK